MRLSRYALGVVVSAVLIFGWGFLFWVILPVPAWSIQGVPAEHLEQLNEALRNLDAGTYVCVTDHQIPGETQEQLAARHAEGPLASFSVDPDGAPMGSPLTLIEGFVHALIASALMALLLVLAAPSLPGYSERLKFVVIAGLFATLWAQPSYSIWFLRSCGATTWYVLYDLGAWLLSGLSLAYFVVPAIRSKKHHTLHHDNPPVNPVEPSSDES